MGAKHIHLCVLNKDTLRELGYLLMHGAHRDQAATLFLDLSLDACLKHLQLWHHDFNTYRIRNAKRENAPESGPTSRVTPNDGDLRMRPCMRLLPQPRLHRLWAHPLRCL